MNEFKDERGREWSLVVDNCTLRRLRKKEGTNLRTATHPRILLWLADTIVDYDRLRIALFSLRATRGDKLDFEDFAAALSPEVLRRAAPVLLRAFADRAASPKLRLGLTKLADKFERQPVA